MTTYIEPMKHYEADISVRRVGIITAPKIPPDHPSVRFSSCLTREVFPACDITEARQLAIALVENPNTPEFLKCLDFYFVPFKTLQWEDWQDPIESVGKVSPQPTGYGDTFPTDFARGRNTDPFLRKPPLSRRRLQMDCQNPCLRSFGKCPHPVTGSGHFP